MPHMVEIEDNFRFRPHHAPNGTFRFLNSWISYPSREELTESFSRSVDWGNSEHSSSLREQLYGGDYLEMILQSLHNAVSVMSDEYAIDFVDSGYNYVDSVVTRRVKNINFLLFGDPKQNIMIGAVIDGECKCTLKKHCCWTLSHDSDDILITRYLERSCATLNTPCEVVDTPDNILEQDELGNLTRAKAVVLTVGEFRDFLLRRLIYYSEYERQLTEEVDRLRSLYKLGYDTEGVFNDLCRVSARKTALFHNPLALIEIDPQEEIVLQERIDEMRKGITS